MDDKRIVKLSIKPFLTAVFMVLFLMVLTYVLTFFLPAGEFRREISEIGQVTIISDTYHHVEGGISFTKWLFSPLFLFGTPDGASVVVALSYSMGWYEPTATLLPVRCWRMQKLSATEHIQAFFPLSSLRRCPREERTSHGATKAQRNLH